MPATVESHRCQVAVADAAGLARCPECGNDGSIVAALAAGVTVMSVGAAAVGADTLQLMSDGCEHEVTVPLSGDVSRHRCVACGRIEAVSWFHGVNVVDGPLGVLVQVAGGFAVQERLL